MKSVAPSDYRSLPALDAPGGYVGVIRDIDRDRYRIEATHWPKALVDAVLAERERSFGIELVALLQTEDLPASEAELYERHQARLSSEWLELDALQLEELARSMLETGAYASQYLIGGSLPSMTGGADPAPGARVHPKRASAAARQSSRRAGGERASRPLASHHYGYWVLGRRHGRASADKDGAGRARQASADWRNDLLSINLIVGFVVIVIVAFIGVGMIRERSFPQRASDPPRSVTIATPDSIADAQASRPRPAGTPFMVLRRAPAHSCPSRLCRLVQSLPERTQIWGLQTVKGSAVNGSTVWIESRLQGRSFVPISYLEPLD